MKKPRRNRQSDYTLVGLIVLYMLLGNAMRTLGPNIAPFLSPEMFSNAAPEQVTHYDIRFDAVNGEFLDTPLYLREAIELIPDEVRFEAYRLVTQMGIAAYEQDFTTVDLLHAEFVERFISDSVIDTAEYELVLRVVNPVEHFTDNMDIVDQVLRAYQYSTVIAQR